MADIVLVNPRFERSYWGLENALPLLGKRANLPTACLPLLAALTPAEHKVTLIDENVEAINYDRLKRADIVGLTGMSVQRRRMRELLHQLKHMERFCVVGGPWVTVQEDYFRGLADVIFVGEAEQTWPQFLSDWKLGRHQQRYEQLERTDMTMVPVPRYDLLRMGQYLFGSVQFSRGCPFQCEFCDIIVTFGRRPRLKTDHQILAELDALRSHGMTVAFVVDDNLIGNKQAIKQALKKIAGWQRANGYPLLLFCEASLDLADDTELMQMMTEANFSSVFIGIETPNEESLRETKKLQNLRSGRTMIEKVHAIQAAGLEVWCGLIVGFDHDDSSTFERQLEFINQARISHAMMGMLSAIPKTPLHKRLAEADRLDENDLKTYGTNVIPARMTREELRDGYLRLQRSLHEPESYFDRLDRLFLEANFRFSQPREFYWRQHPWKRLQAYTMDVARCLGVFVRLMTHVPNRKLTRLYRERILRLIRSRREPSMAFAYLLKCAVHYHHYSMAEEMSSAHAPLINSF